MLKSATQFLSFIVALRYIIFTAEGTPNITINNFITSEFRAIGIGGINSCCTDFLFFRIRFGYNCFFDILSIVSVVDRLVLIPC